MWSHRKVSPVHRRRLRKKSEIRKRCQEFEMVCPMANKGPTREVTMEYGYPYQSLYRPWSWILKLLQHLPLYGTGGTLTGEESTSHTERAWCARGMSKLARRSL